MRYRTLSDFILNLSELLGFPFRKAFRLVNSRFCGYLSLSAYVYWVFVCVFLFGLGFLFVCFVFWLIGFVFL